MGLVQLAHGAGNVVQGIYVFEVFDSHPYSLSAILPHPTALLPTPSSHCPPLSFPPPPPLEALTPPSSSSSSHLSLYKNLGIEFFSKRI
jgi:hypothetical protein